MGIRFGTAIHAKMHVGMSEDAVFIVDDRPLSADKHDSVSVIQHPHLVGCQQFSAGNLEVRRKVPPHTVAPSVGIGINGFFPKQFTHIFVGTLLISAQIDKLIAITHDALPLLFKQGLELGKVLQDDTDRNTAGAHDRQDLVEVIRQTYVGELIHQEMDVNGERPAVFVVREGEKLLEYLGVEDGNKEVKAGIIIGDDSKEGDLPLSHALQIQLVHGGQGRKAFQIELFQSCRQGDLNGLQGFGRTRPIRLVILQGDMILVLGFEDRKQIVQHTSLRLVFLVHVRRPQKLHDHREVLLLGWGFVFEVKDQRQEEHLRRRVPKGVVALTSLGGGGLKEIGHESLHIVVALDIFEGIVSVRAFHIDEIQHTHLISFGFEKSSRVPQKFPLGIKADK